MSNEALLVNIKAVHIELREEYGLPKRRRELVGRGIHVSKVRVCKTRSIVISCRGRQTGCWATMLPTSPRVRAGCT
jgi:hypothetical protein